VVEVLPMYDESDARGCSGAFLCARNASVVERNPKLHSQPTSPAPGLVSASAAGRVVLFHYFLRLFVERHGEMDTIWPMTRFKCEKICRFLRLFASSFWKTVIKKGRKEGRRGCVSGGGGSKWFGLARLTMFSNLCQDILSMKLTENAFKLGKHKQTV
jgi:hypothetical protein